MRDTQTIGKDRSSVSRWTRENVIEVAALWIQLYRAALANIRVR
jgi:hypothetical protein